MFALATLFSLVAAPAALAVAINRRADASPVTLSSATVTGFTSAAFIAAAAYCDPSTIQDMSCGPNCDALPGFIPTATGGDGVDKQFFFVGFDPVSQSVVVAHQGTDPKKIVPLLTDADFFLENLDPTLFPGISDDVKAHNGFLESQADSAAEVLAAVKQTMNDHLTTQVTLASHSLGAAISVLDALFLSLNLPDTTSFKIVNFGQPRIGNQAFADLIDSKFNDLTHISNQKDPVPIIPGRFLGFVHPSGEVHIQESGNFVFCAGQDSEANGCDIDDVPNLLLSKLANHDGPYLGATMGGDTCV